MDLDKLKELIVKHEGERLDLYRCTAGKLTIGIGHNIQDKGISKAVSTLMFEEDIKKRINRSPDEGDAAALTFAEPVKVVSSNQNWRRKRNRSAMVV